MDTWSQLRDIVRKNKLVATLIVLLFTSLLVITFLLGGRNNPSATSIPTSEVSTPEANVPLCEADPIKFDSIQIDGTTVTFTYSLPKNFNSGIDYGDGTHSHYKANVTADTLVAKETYVYSRPGTYEVGLYTYDYELVCDNGAATKIVVP